MYVRIRGLWKKNSFKRKQVLQVFYNRDSQQGPDKYVLFTWWLLSFNINPCVNKQLNGTAEQIGCPVGFAWPYIIYICSISMLVSCTGRLLHCKATACRKTGALWSIWGIVVIRKRREKWADDWCRLIFSFAPWKLLTLLIDGIRKWTVPQLKCT